MIKLREWARGVATTDNDVRGQDPLLRRQRPNVHVVDFKNAVDRDFAFDLFIIELARFALHDEPDQIARNRECRR